MNKLKSRYNILIARKALLQKDLNEKRRKLKKIEGEQSSLFEIREIFTQVGVRIRKQFKKKTEPLITLAIQSVFVDRPLEFRLRFDNDTGKVKPIIKEGEFEYDPKSEKGGGLLNVVAFALRIVKWRMSGDRSRNLFILDEPFHFTGALVDKAGEMLQYLSKKLKFQVLILTHEEALKNICNIAYKTVHNGTETKVKLIKQRKLRRRK